MSTLLPALISVALIAAPDVYWNAVGAPEEVQPKSYVLDGDTMAVLGQDGSIHRLGEAGWVHVTGPPPAGAAYASRMMIGPDGTIFTGVDNRSTLHRFDGQDWHGPITLPVGYTQGMAFAPDGRTWVYGLHGFLVRKVADGWETVPGMPLESDVDSNIFGGVFDRDGTLWLTNPETLLLRVDGAGGARLEHGQQGRFGVALDGHGRPLLVGDQLRRLDEEGWPVLVDRPVQAAVQVGDDWFLLSDGRFWWTDLEEVVELPFPSVHRPAGLQVTRDGRLFATDFDRNLYELKVGSAPVLRNTASDWGLATLTDTGGAEVGDFDGDGLDDLVVLSDDGDLRLLLQRGGSFLDVTGEWGLSLRPVAGHFAVCDLDGNGLPDIVTREAVAVSDAGLPAVEGEPTDGEEPAEDIRLGYRRTFPGRFVDASDSLSGPVPIAVSERGVGLFTCADVDMDGDLDVLTTSGGKTLSPGPRVALYENVGYGHLRSVTLPERGLGLGGGWVVQILVDDIDQDGLTDFVAVNSWGRGHDLLRGTPEHGVTNLSAGSGFDAIYGTAIHGWTARIDDDPYPDIVVLDRVVGPRIWRGSADMRLEEVTQAWGLGGNRPWRSETCFASALTDLNADGHIDLLVGCKTTPVGLLLGTGDQGFVDRSDALPARSMAPKRIVDLDLGGDGDRDLLILYVGDDELLENVGAAVATAPATVKGYTSSSVPRSLSWARVFPDGLLAAALLAIWLGGIVVTRTRGGDLALGRPVRAAVVVVVAAVAFVLLLEHPVWTRVLLVVGSGVTAVLWSLLEVAETKRRSAVNVGGFLLGDILGKGGFGAVYRARHARSGAVAAVKMIKREHLADDRDRARFHAEAAACAAIRDDRVVRVFGKGEYTPYGEEGDAPVAYLVMELLQGLSLRQLLEEAGRLDASAASAIGMEVGLALKAVADAGIVHRDVKPDNVMIVRPAKVKVMDFGIARQSTDTDELEVMGTLAYMAPEQLLGQDEPTHRTDLYSLGVVLYELITGVRPFEGTRGEVVDGILYGSPAPFADHDASAPPEVEALVMQALAKEPEDRPSSGLEVATRLEAWAGEVPVVTVGTAPVADVSPDEVARYTSGHTQGRANVLWRLLRSWASWARSERNANYHEFLLSLVFDEARDPEAGEDLSTRLMDGLVEYRGDQTRTIVTRAHAPDQGPAATAAPVQLKGPPPLPTELKAFGMSSIDDGEEES